jgi:mevalonate kinase
MDENHQHLAALGVSHPALENIRERLGTQYNLTTKLTGAGGGGCTVSLIPDGKNSTLFSSRLA